MTPKNPISISTAPLNRLSDRPYYDLDNTLTLMQRLLDAGAADGFEFQNLAEWDARCPPQSEPGRAPAWEISPRYTINELATILRDSGMPILSIHANRDVGMCLCSDKVADVARGKQLIHESLALAEGAGASVCVFHLWDTWKEHFAPQFLQDTLDEIAPQHPRVKAAVENVPTHLSGTTPFDLIQAYPWITLDLRWAALYDEFDKFASLKDRIANVHLSGQLNGSSWALAPEWFPSQKPTFTFDSAVDTLCTLWAYTGPLTLEMYRPSSNTWENIVAAMQALKLKTSVKET